MTNRSPEILQGVFRGYSQDGRIPMITRPWFTSLSVYPEYVIDSSLQNTGTRYVEIGENLPALGEIISYQDDLTGGSWRRLIVNRDGELMDFQVSVFPMMYDHKTKQIFHDMLVEMGPTEQKDNVLDLLRALRCDISSREGLVVRSYDSEILHVNLEGEPRVGTEYSPAASNKWSAVRQYTYTDNSEITATVSSVHVTQPIVDAYGNNLIFADFPASYYIVGGVLFGKSPIYSIVETVREDLQSGTYSDSRVRDVLMPFISVEPIHDSVRSEN